MAHLARPLHRCHHSLTRLPVAHLVSKVFLHTALMKDIGSDFDLAAQQVFITNLIADGGYSVLAIFKFVDFDFWQKAC